MKRTVGDIKYSKKKKNKYKRRKKTCNTKTVVRANLRNLEKLMIRNCVKMIRCMIILRFTETYSCIQSVEILDKMENCGTGGLDFDKD